MGQKDSLTHNPLFYPTAFEIPKWQNSGSSAKPFIPFLFAIVEILRPDIIVEAGTPKGDAYFAFCQNVKKLDLSTNLFAFSSWENKELYEALKIYNEQNFSSFSKLIQGSSPLSNEYFQPASIDLLYLSEYSNYSELRNSFSTLLPYLSNKGVLLLDNIKSSDNARFWQELRKSYQGFELMYNDGFGLIQIGQLVSPDIQLLLRSPKLNISMFYESLNLRLTQIERVKELIESFITTLDEINEMRGKLLLAIKKNHKTLKFLSESPTKNSELIGQLQLDEERLTEHLLELEIRRKSITVRIKESTEKYNTTIGRRELSWNEISNDHIKRSDFSD